MCGRRPWMAAITAAVALAVLGAAPAGAGAKSPWLFTGASSVPTRYFQGLTSNPDSSSLYFIGVFEGLWRTTPELSETAGVSTAIPSQVTATEGYNHAGDPTWYPRGAGGVVLPMECYYPNQDPSNTCGTGSFGIADPKTLEFRFYVKLDPAEIPKAMWAETSPDGKLIWTSSGDDLLAYRAKDVVPANAGPDGPVIHAARRLDGAVPPTGVTGAAFWHGKLLLGGSSDGTYQVWSVNLDTGNEQVVIEKHHICGESEGLDVVPTLGGRLHWLLSPFAPGCDLTYGPTSAVMHFVPRQGDPGLDVDLQRVEGSPAPGAVVAHVRVTRHDAAVDGARVRFAGASGTTNARGRATVTASLQQPGYFKALARRNGRFGLSGLAPVGFGATARQAPAPPVDPG